eukprot:gene8460-40928_t
MSPSYAHSRFSWSILGGPARRRAFDGEQLRLRDRLRALPWRREID